MLLKINIPEKVNLFRNLKQVVNLSVIVFLREISSHATNHLLILKCINKFKNK